MTTASDYACHDLDKRGWCTCAGGFSCACRPAGVAGGGPTACIDCRTPCYHRKACGDCETFPCVCPPYPEAWRVHDAIWRAVFEGKYGPPQLPPASAHAMQSSSS